MLPCKIIKRHQGVRSSRHTVHSHCITSMEHLLWLSLAMSFRGRHKRTPHFGGPNFHVDAALRALDGSGMNDAPRSKMENRLWSLTRGVSTFHTRLGLSLAKVCKSALFPGRKAGPSDCVPTNGSVTGEGCWNRWGPVSGSSDALRDERPHSRNDIVRISASSSDGARKPKGGITAPNRSGAGAGHQKLPGRPLISHGAPSSSP